MLPDLFYYIKVCYSDLIRMTQNFVHICVQCSRFLKAFNIFHITEPLPSLVYTKKENIYNENDLKDYVTFS